MNLKWSSLGFEETNILPVQKRKASSKIQPLYTNLYTCISTDRFFIFHFKKKG